MKENGRLKSENNIKQINFKELNQILSQLKTRSSTGFDTNNTTTLKMPQKVSKDKSWSY